MDAEISISYSLKRLRDLIGDKAKISFQSLEPEVQAAINNLEWLQLQLREAADGHEDEASSGHQRLTQLVKAVYSAEDATDILLVRKGRENRLTFLWSQIVFICEMKKFNDEVRCLMKGARAYSDNKNNNNNNIPLSSFQYDKDHARKRQRWGRIFDSCMEEETQVIVGLQQQIINKLVLWLNVGPSGVDKAQAVGLQQVNKLVLGLIPRFIPRFVNLNVGPSSVDDEISKEQQLINSTGEATSTSQIFDMSAGQVIAVVGEGGSGKTTLARSVYNSFDVKRHFTTRAWVRVPNMFKARGVLADIIQQINQDELVDATLSEDALMTGLTKLLKGTRFLIVLDDVKTLQVWNSLVSAISSSSKDGKVIIIVCNEACLPKNGCSTLQISKLNNEESWKLFLNKVRVAEDELNNSKLIGLKEQILRVCDGLPSVIVLLGGLLSTKEKNYDEWSRLLANKTSGDIMALSYQDLPSGVKPCFLHMGLFPRGFEISVRRLIHLWCAEGFVTPLVSEEIDPEDVAEICLEELVIRNMVQVRWRSDGTPKTCCLPNVLHDFFSSKATNVGFLHHHFQPSLKQQKVAIRRLAANVDINSFPSSWIQNIRTCIAFDRRLHITPTRAIYEFLHKIVNKRGFGLLRVLDLEGVYRPFLSSYTISRLFLLIHLSLRSTCIDHLPEWVELMPYLETLDVKHTNIKCVTLPQANKLRHIYLSSIYDPYTSSFLKDSTNLRTLWGLIIPSFSYPSEYSNAFRMTSLTKLRILRCEEASAMVAVAEWIHQLTKLQSLKMKLINSGGYVPDITLWSMAEHHRLQELYLLAKMSPSKIDVGFLPPNLRKLTLSLSQLEEDPMQVLGQLPHLKVLRLLSCSYKGEKMTCLSKGFPKLHQLKLWKLPVRVWTVKRGAMPCLRELEIRSCDHMKLPQGLQNVTTLKELVLTNMPENFGAAIAKSLHDRDIHIRNNTWNSDPIPI